MRENAVESVKNCFDQKSTSVTDFFFIQCHLLVQTILSMKIMYQPEFLPYHQRAVLEPTTQKDSQHSIHGEYFDLFLLSFFLIVDSRFQRILDTLFSLLIFSREIVDKETELSLFIMVYFNVSIYIKCHVKEEKICWVTKCLTYLTCLSLCSSDRNAVFH